MEDALLEDALLEDALLEDALLEDTLLEDALLEHCPLDAEVFCALVDKDSKKLQTIYLNPDIDLENSKSSVTFSCQEVLAVAIDIDESKILR